MRKFSTSGLEEENGVARNSKRRRLGVIAGNVSSQHFASRLNSFNGDGFKESEGFLSTPYCGDSDGEVEDLPCDTLAAILLLKSEFKLTTEEDSVIYPVVLKTQLYSILEDKTFVDREVDVLRHERKIRCFKLSFGPDEYAVMLADDYERELRNCRPTGGTQLCCKDSIFDTFVDKVLPQVEDVSLSHDDLVSCLSGANLGDLSNKLKPVRKSDVDSEVSLLLNKGFLTRTSVGRSGYFFNSPSVGRIVSSVVKGRKEIVGLLRRKKKHPEMFEKDLLGKKCKLKQSILPMKFHLRDMVGKGVLAEMKTTRGLVLRVANKVL